MRAHPPVCLCPSCRARRRALLRAAIRDSGQAATAYDALLLASGRTERRAKEVAP